MTMSEVGRRDQLVDPINGGDVAADGTLLSVAEIQQRFREERARRGLATTPRTAPAAATPADRPRDVGQFLAFAPHLLLDDPDVAPELIDLAAQLAAQIRVAERLHPAVQLAHAALVVDDQDSGIRHGVKVG